MTTDLEKCTGCFQVVAQRWQQLNGFGSDFLSRKTGPGDGNQHFYFLSPGGIKITFEKDLR